MRANSVSRPRRARRGLDDAGVGIAPPSSRTSVARHVAAHHAVGVEHDHVAVAPAPAAAEVGDVAALALDAVRAPAVEDAAEAADRRGTARSRRPPRRRACRDRWCRTARRSRSARVAPRARERLVRRAQAARTRAATSSLQIGITIAVRASGAIGASPRRGARDREAVARRAAARRSPPAPSRSRAETQREQDREQDQDRDLERLAAVVRQDARSSSEVREPRQRRARAPAARDAARAIRRRRPGLARASGVPSARASGAAPSTSRERGVWHQPASPGAVRTARRARGERDARAPASERRVAGSPLVGELACSAANARTCATAVGDRPGRARIAAERVEIASTRRASSLITRRQRCSSRSRVIASSPVRRNARSSTGLLSSMRFTRSAIRQPPVTGLRIRVGSRRSRRCCRRSPRSRPCVGGQLLERRPLEVDDEADRWRRAACE